MRWSRRVPSRLVVPLRSISSRPSRAAASRPSREVAADPVAPHAITAYPAPVREKGPLVYVLEPNPLMVEVERAVLRPFRLRFLSSEELVGAVLRAPPSLVITEVLLSGTDGLSLCRELKNYPPTSGVPVLVFSVLEASEEAFDAGADGFLRKPVGREELLGTARRLAGGYPGTAGGGWSS